MSNWNIWHLGAAVIVALVTVTANAQSQRLSAQQIAKVESGGGSQPEQMQYVFGCLSDTQGCESALMQIWQTNGNDVALAKYLPPDDQVPALFRGTEIGRRMRNIGAFNKCVGDERCIAFLINATKSIRSLSPEELKLAYQAKVEMQEVAMQNSSVQIGQNLEKAVAQIRTNGSPLPGIAPAVAQPPMEAGGVIDFARDPYSNVTIQMVRLPNGNREIQRRKDSESKRLATVKGREGKWLVELDDGTQLESADVQLTSRGFVAGTNARPISYTEAGGLVKLDWPIGFHTAKTQRGNVAQTGYVLLERDIGDKRGLGGLMSSLGGVGTLLGVSRQEDYLLLDMHSGKTYPLNISASGKDVTVMSNCRAKNAVINICRDAETRENLYDKYGKNMSHYAWGIYWFRAPTGTYLAALEDGFRNVSITKLETGEKRIAFTRSMGISDFSAIQDESGRVSVNAKLAFTRETIGNLEVAFNSLPLADAANAPANK